MKFLKKIKSSNFWVSMISAVILILQAVFNVDIKTEYLTQIILGILGVLVMSGIVTDTDSSSEMTVKQSFDAESIKETINTMLTQIGTTLQMDITKIVSQFDNTTQTKTDEKVTENLGAQDTNSTTQIQTVQQVVETQVIDNGLNTQTVETKIENGVEQKQDEIVKDEKQEQVIISQIQSQPISIIETRQVINNAPKNEL